MHCWRSGSSNADIMWPRHASHPSSALPPTPQALAAAEALSGASGPRIALVLLLTAHSYSRTGRVTLAEGLYREAAKMLQLRPEAAGACGGGRMMVGV